MSLDPIVGAVVGSINKLLIQEFKFLDDVKDDFTSLKDELMMMNINFQDMEEEGDDERSRVVIKEIRKLAYDAEDLIESYIFEAGFSESKKGGFMERYVCFCGSLRPYTLASKVTTLRKRINGITERSNKFFGEIGVGIQGRDQGVKRTRFMEPITYPNSYEEHVVGLEEDINKLVGVLTADETQIDGVSIVGMSGSGKTTLARKLYNHEFVQTHFDCISWVSLSKEWVAKEILLNLLKDAKGQTMRTDEALSRQELAERLHQYLESKRYLIVFDGVWTRETLEEILPYLPSVNACRKIIVTTSKLGVTNVASLNCIEHDPRRLSAEESWELFRNIAFRHREESSDSTDIFLFEELGKEMLQKCEGLPLAVIVLARILEKKETIEEWENAKKEVSSRIMKYGKGTHGPVYKMLALSCNDLPPKTKLCFLYLVNFRKDGEIDVKKLIRMYIAEGFITLDELHMDGEDTKENVARGYLNHLIHHCLVQVTRYNYDGMVLSIRMHDLVGGLCMKIANEQEFAEIFTSRALHAQVINSRRVAISPDDGEDIPFPTKCQLLRSLIYNGFRNEYCQNLNLQLIHQSFRFLRVLLLHCIGSSDSILPAGIGSLIHLRYLGLMRMKIGELPSSIGNLRNLQTLVCSGMYRFRTVRIPDVFWKIAGLEHLEIAYAQPIEGKLELDTLKSLQTLRGIKGGDWMLKELPLLSQTVQELEICEITSQEQLEAAFQCPSIEFDRLHSLALDWEMERDGVVMLKNSIPIIHCQQLKELRLVGRIEDAWDGCHIQFPNCIQKLVLWNTGFKAEATLTALGNLPSLIILHLVHESYMGAKWTCFSGEFPQLKELLLRGLPNLQEWSIERGAMPQLSHLTVQICKKLKRLPEGLKFIKGLQELTLHNMSAEFKERVKGVHGTGAVIQDAHIIEHVPIVRL